MLALLYSPTAQFAFNGTAFNLLWEPLLGFLHPNRSAEAFAGVNAPFKIVKYPKIKVKFLWYICVQ